MAHAFLATFILAGALAAQAPAAGTPGTTPADKPEKTDKKEKVDPNKPITMNGCVAKDTASAKVYTFTDMNGFKYRLSGQDVSKYVGQPLQIVGVMDNNKLKIKGGLYPSPNVAAQAGAMDPGKAHVAELGGGTTGSGNPDLPTFRVAQVSAATGECRK
jgi:hypothetical protein